MSVATESVVTFWPVRKLFCQTYTLQNMCILLQSLEFAFKIFTSQYSMVGYFIISNWYACVIIINDQSCFCLATRSQSRRAAPRAFCDICDVFDQHETEDCPLQEMSDSPPPTQYHGDRNQVRPYCDICEGKSMSTLDICSKTCIYLSSSLFELLL